MFRLFLAACSTSALFFGSVTVDAEDRVQFNRDIRPILSDNCFQCHGFDEASREAELRLDTFEAATEWAVVPGEPDESELVARLLTHDPDLVMPPPSTEKRVSPEEVRLIRRWIEQGAEYEVHWAWTKPWVPTVPGGQRSNHAANIDAFLEAGWAENNASPVQLASPRQQLRRLSFDLRGIPPTFKEVQSFASDPSQEAFEAFRERWMAELAYAEHQAVRWLDLVRWADTSGFVSDEPIASGAYRAWVIRAFQNNMPFDEFSIDQLAGDLRDNPTDEQLIASGYNRIVNTNCEAGAIEEEQLYKLKGEHVRAFGTVWMGMTTGCAECHDHKFDPFSAKDYYSLAAFFDDLVEAGVYTPGDRREPLHYVHDDDNHRTADRNLQNKLTAVLHDLMTSEPPIDRGSWQKDIQSQLKDSKSRSDFVWIPAQFPAARIIEGDFSIEQSGSTENPKSRNVRVSTAPAGHFRRHHAAELMTGYINHGSYRTDAKKDAWYADVWIDPENRPSMIGLQISHGDYGRLGWRTANFETYVWGEDTSGTLKRRQPWSEPDRVLNMGAVPDESGWVRLEIPFEKLIKPVGGQSFEAVGMAWLQTGGRLKWGGSGLQLRTDKATALRIGETAIRKWWQIPFNRQVFQRRMEYAVQAVQKTESNRDALQKEIAEAVFREFVMNSKMDEIRRLESELWRLRSTSIPVLVSRQAGDWKTTRLLNRGDYQDKSGPVVTADFPGLLGSLKQKERNRLALGKWLFDENNPLTARVYVNRLWHQFYGRGLSETLEDSGTQGDWPSHVKLLEYLANEFRRSEWDRNHMVRLLTSTRAYRLSSIPTADLASRDPSNRWHARQGRQRLPAEVIRDSSLLAAGLLQLTSDVPTASFFPYQPDPYWTSSDKVMYGSRHLEWETNTGPLQYQRSMYTFWKRQNIHPTMLAFDAPTRQECTAKRNTTNTPGQALALLNDPIFVEAARVFAERIYDAADTDRSRIQAAYRTAVQRAPTSEEVGVLMNLLTKLREHYQGDRIAAALLIGSGDADKTTSVSVAELATWTVVARTILNLHESLTRP